MSANSAKVVLDFGSAPSVLSALLDRELTQKAINAAADKFKDDVVFELGVAEDEGRIFSETGILADSIHVKYGHDLSAEVYSDAVYAGFVEFGTEEHEIAARGFNILTIPTDDFGFSKSPRSEASGVRYTHSVHHPGSTPHPFFFKDLTTRQHDMENAAISVLNRGK